MVKIISHDPLYQPADREALKAVAEKREKHEIDHGRELTPFAAKLLAALQKG